MNREFWAYLSFLCALMAAAFSFFGLLSAPTHCRYLVPVVGKPGIFSCSSSPQAKETP